MVKCIVTIAKAAVAGLVVGAMVCRAKTAVKKALYRGRP